MKEIVEGGIKYEVSDNYPDKPYVKRMNVTPVAKRTIKKWDLVSSFSMPEWLDFDEKAKTNTDLTLFKFFLTMATDDVDKDDPIYIAGLAAIVAAGIITQEKADGLA